MYVEIKMNRQKESAKEESIDTERIFNPIAKKIVKLIFFYQQIIRFEFRSKKF